MKVHFTFLIFQYGNFAEELETMQEFANEDVLIQALIAFAARESKVRLDPRVMPIFSSACSIDLPVAKLGYGPGTSVVIRELNILSETLSAQIDDERTRQARVLWDKGLGQNVIIGFDLTVPGLDGFGEFNVSVPGTPVVAKSFEDYLATIPEIPAALLADDPELPLLRLVDPRLGLSKSCELFGIKFKELGYSDADVVACDTRHEIPNAPFWVRAHDGRKNRNRKPNVCRDECKGKLFSMTAMVAIMVWIQDPSIIKQGEHVLDCPGSVHRAARGGCAFLGVWHGEVRLNLGGFAGDASLSYGAGGFRRE